MLDPDTNENHIPPVGLEHMNNPRKNGRFYMNPKFFHYIIKLHQDCFPDLKTQMKNNNNASNVYCVFLALLPLQLKGKLTIDIKNKILKTYGVI